MNEDGSIELVYSPIRAGSLKASGSTYGKCFLGAEAGFRISIIVWIRRSDYSSAWLRPRIDSFRFAQQEHCGAGAIGVLLVSQHSVCA